MGKKRQRQEEKEELVEPQPSDTDQIPSFEESLTFSDTLVALRIMRAQFPRIEKVSIQPFILRSQLYSSVSDRTQVDRELESMRREKLLRIFKLNTGQDDHGIMFMEDYLSQMGHVVKRMEEKNLGDLQVFEWFKNYVVDICLEPSIDHQELCLLLSHGGKVKDEHISLLINAGLLFLTEDIERASLSELEWLKYTRNLDVCSFEVPFDRVFPILSCDDFFPGIPGPVGINGIIVAEHIVFSWPLRAPMDALSKMRQLIDPSAYWFTIPNVGSVLKGLSQGRKELLSLLNRRRYKEMMLAPLEKKRLRLSLLDMRFHLRDLIGSGRLKTVNTPTGLVVRVSKD